MTVQRRLEMAGNIDSELLLNFIEHFPDYLSALSRTIVRCFGQPLSKQLYKTVRVRVIRKPINAYPRLKVNRGFHLAR